jgi:hypothetical protein
LVQGGYVSGSAVVTGKAEVMGGTVTGKAVVRGYASVNRGATIGGTAAIYGGIWPEGWGEKVEVLEGRWRKPGVRW